MSDALITPAVAGATFLLSAALFAVAARKIKKEPSEKIIPLMGVMGAFIFAAQMINFSIPGTGSSGHIVGGVLLAAVLGPWAAFVALSSVLVIQCLVFADGGLMALGCNILNMGAFTCLVAYPLIYEPLMKYPASLGRILWVSLLTCIAGLELGAVAVTLETEASGVTQLPIGEFLLFMLPIHLLIGIGEGLATAAVLYFVQKHKPEMLYAIRKTEAVKRQNRFCWKKSIWTVAAMTLFFAVTFQWIASSNPDGLEWSIEHVSGNADITESESATKVQTIQENMSLMPEYDNAFSGIVGGLLVVLILWAFAAMLQSSRKHISKTDGKS